MTTPRKLSSRVLDVDPTERTATFGKLVDELNALYEDPNTDPDTKEKLKAMLTAISDDPEESEAARRSARKAMARVESRDAMLARMGVRNGTSAPCVRRDGRSVIFGGPPVARRDTGVSPDEHARIRTAMGLPAEGGGVRRERNAVVFGVQTAEQARRAIEASKK